MISRYKHKDVTWIDIESPTKEDIDSLIDEYHIHPLVGAELLQSSARAKADVYPEMIYFILHFPKYKDAKTGKGAAREIDFVLGKDYLITAHYEHINSIYEFGKAFETASILDKAGDVTNVGSLFWSLIKKLYDGLENEIELIGDDLTKAEVKIFTGHEQHVVEVLSRVNKGLIDFKRLLKAHEEVLASIELNAEHFFGKRFEHYSHAIIGEYERIWNILESNRELLQDLRETNDSLFSAKMNNVMKNLTAMAFLTFPLTLLAAVFSMRAESMPIIGMPHDFWIIVGMMVAFTFLMITLFKFNKWI